MSRRVELLCAWSGPLLILLVFCGLVPLAQLIPPPDADDSAAEIKAFFVEHKDGIRIGMVLVMIGGALAVPWSVGLASQLKRAIAPPPALTYVQVAAGAFFAVLMTMVALTGSLAAFRPEELSADVTRLLDDTLWFWWLIPWPLFTIWVALIGVLVMQDRAAEPLFPRWAGYLSLWAALLFTPGSLAIFFKTGAFAFNGLVVWYVPTVVFFVWMVVMTVLMIRAAKLGAAPPPRPAPRPSAELDLDPVE